ncbi:unnamed protein product, partial [Iphiclides podalirius]
MDGNLRMKRAKYYSSPPQRLYKRPPTSPHGAFSYTPPPNYMMDDEDQVPNYRPSRHSRRPGNEGLGDEDIHNLMKYLSKKDLDKIVEYAVEKDKYMVTRGEKPIYSKPENNYDHTQDFERNQKFSFRGPYANPDNGYKQTNIDYPYHRGNQIAESNPTGPLDGSLQDAPGKLYFDAPLESEETIKSQQFAVLDAYIQQEINGMGGEKGLSIFTDGKDMREEQLPAPLNLRHEDYDISFTNNVPTVVKADGSSYKVESFGELPLMNYNSKLHSVSSYNVPHYTVTTPNMNQPAAQQSKSLSSPPPPADGNPLLEVAPPVTNYRDQSDAHLKATKIWTHKSKGTAYYLHPDGSLSLERPLRPRPKYG